MTMSNDIAEPDRRRNRKRAGELDYYLVKLVKGPTWKPGFSISIFVLQIRHLGNLWRLRRMKRAPLAGPLAGNGRIRGIVILRAESEAEAKALIETDPAVQVGRLSFEIRRL